jgi:hypothetical protein
MIGALMGLPGKIKTLLDRLTATRAGYLDRLDAAVTTRAAASTALTNTTWTDTRAGYLDGMFRIKAIYRDTIVLSSAASNYKYLPASVVTSKSVVSILGYSFMESHTNPVGNMIQGVRLELSSAYIYAYTDGAPTSYGGTLTVAFQVVEFY